MIQKANIDPSRGSYVALSRNSLKAPSNRYNSKRRNLENQMTTIRNTKEINNDTQTDYQSNNPSRKLRDHLRSNQGGNPTRPGKNADLDQISANINAAPGLITRTMTVEKLNYIPNNSASLFKKKNKNQSKIQKFKLEPTTAQKIIKELTHENKQNEEEFRVDLKKHKRKMENFKQMNLVNRAKRIKQLKFMPVEEIHINNINEYPQDHLKVYNKLPATDEGDL